VFIADRQGRQCPTLPQQETSNSEEFAAGRLYPSRRGTFDEFESFADIFATGAPPAAHV
jgi:hypothetical protein